MLTIPDKSIQCKSENEMLNDTQTSQKFASNVLNSFHLMPAFDTPVISLQQFFTAPLPLTVSDNMFKIIAFLILVKKHLFSMSTISEKTFEI